ncbi:hypothetical protein DENSPDRAFT_877365 [Dentipellis sp. KUC8613]|nr:hypothetical protein DENSPDRAFT_877365 [Dentipellis sp. KUC8613]
MNAPLSEPPLAASHAPVDRAMSVDAAIQGDSALPFDCSSPEFEEFMAMFKDSSIPPLDSSDPTSFQFDPSPMNEGSHPNTPATDLPFHPSTTLDSMIDPQLLGMSASPVGVFPQHERQGSVSGSLPPLTPNLVESPEASTSSFAGPLTPQWEEPHTEPEVHSNEPDQGPPAMASLRPSLHAPPEASCLRWTTPIYQQPSFPPAHPQALSTPAPPPSVALASTQRLLSVLDSKRLAQSPAVKSANKQDIIRRARDRRAQLMAELERAKVQLWETTIEQGVLAHLAKDSG